MDNCLQSCHLLKRASTLSEKHVSRALAGLPINLSQAMLLLCVADKHVTSMSELGKSLCCHKSNVTQIVDYLLVEKLISRSPSKEDRRVQHIAITARGKELIGRIHKGMEEHASECMEGLVWEDAKKLSQLLAKYIAHAECVCAEAKID